MADSPYIFEVNAQNFTDVVLEGSSRQPVLVDFWADWCNPCRMLMPVLAKLAQDYNGQFVLAKVNSDENQELAAKYGVRSLPTVKLFKDGVAVDEFMGALPESQVVAFLDKYIERESDRLMARAGEAQAAGDQAQALSLLEKANEIDPGRVNVVCALAEIMIDMGQSDAAEQLLLALPMQEQVSGPVAGLLARIRMVRESGDLPALEQLQTEVAQNPDSVEFRYQLAMRQIAEHNYEPALENLLEVMRRDRKFGDDAARKTLLQTFEMMGSDSLANQYRQKMFNLLY